MTMSNSSLVSYTRLSPNHSGKRTMKIDRITPHCVVGQCTAEGLGDWFAQSSTQASSNYGIDRDGRVGLYVDEGNRSWCSSSNANDQRAVTIECASDTSEPYAFRDVVYQRLIDLCTDICKRNGKKKLIWFGDKNTTLNYSPKSDEMILTVHRWFADKSCPGSWMYARMGDLASKVTARLGSGIDPEPAPQPTPPKKGEIKLTPTQERYLYSAGIHYISNSGSDENGNYSGGQAGDQTGKEWRMRDWYNRPWNHVLRHPDQRVALMLALLGIDAALNDKIGYDQSQNRTYLAQLKKVGWQPSKISVACEADCSAGVCANVTAVGYLLGIPELQNHTGTYTGNMRAALKKAGFQDLTDSKYLTSGNYLLPGDILLYESHHTATNVTLGSKVKSSWHPGDVPVPTPTPTPKPTPSGDIPYLVKITADVLNIRSGPGTDNSRVGSIRDHGVYTIVAESSGKGATLWGKLKSGAGWISLDYTKKL